MSVHALIIAIESYPLAEGLVARELEGTHEGAKKFLRWLVDHHDVDEANILVNTDALDFPIDAGQLFGAESDDLAHSVERLVHDVKADGAKQLFVFFSGHGFFLMDKKGKRTDLLVTREFRDESASGRACIGLDEIQQRLRIWLGPGEHFYFVDACRNERESEQIEQGGLGLRFDTVPGDPTVFTLYSTRRGFAASTASGFATCVADGLAGRSRAKIWDGPKMAVGFDSLANYVKLALVPQEADKSVLGFGTGLIADLYPVPTYNCQIHVRDAAPSDSFTLDVRNDRGQHLQSLTFAGANQVYSNVPGDYVFQVRHAAYQVTPAEVPVDLYEDATAQFAVDHGAPPDPPPDPTGGVESATVRFEGAVDADLSLARIDDALRVEQVDEAGTSVPLGLYNLSVRDRSGGRLLHQSEVDIRAPGVIDLGPLTRGRRQTAQQSIATALPGEPTASREVILSDRIGPLPDFSLSVWLAVVGASRIISEPSDFTKIGHFPLWDASAAPADSAPLYFLAGLEPELEGRLHIGVWPGPEEVSVDAAPNMPGLFQAVVDCTPGPRYLTVRLEGSPVTTIVTHGFANRATLVTATRDEQDRLQFGQYMLPIAHLRDRLSDHERQRIKEEISYRLEPTAYRVLPDAPGIPDRGIDSVRFMAQAQRSFADHHTVAPLQNTPDYLYWQELLYAKWLDPVMGVIASYELVRRGQTETLSEVVDNLRRFFSGLPDTEVLARLIGGKHVRPDSPPMVLDGMLAIEDADYDGMPARNLDYDSSWTTWTGVEPTRTSQ